MAKTSNKTITVEQVGSVIGRSGDQRQTLVGLGCHEAQGMVYAPAMAQPDLLAWLGNRGR